jgi:hypothetical protein
MTTRKSFPVYLSWAGPIEMLSIEEKAQLLDNLMMYYQGEEPVLNTPMLTMFWKSIEHFLKESDTAYKNKVDGGKKAVENRERNRKLKNDTANLITVLHGTANQDTVPQIDLRDRVSKDKDKGKVKDEDKDKDKVNVNDEVKYNVNVKTHNSSFIPKVYKPTMSAFDEMFNDI